IWRLLESLEQEAAALPARTGGRAQPAGPGPHASQEQAGSHAREAASGAQDREAEAALQRCRELLAALAAHNAKEEPIIYPQGDVVLSEEVKQDLHQFIREGTMPSGWVCEQAS